MKKVFLVEVEVADGIDFNPKVWEASLNVAYEGSGKFRVSAQPSVQADFACTCGKCSPLKGNEEFCKFTRRPMPQSR